MSNIFTDLGFTDEETRILVQKAKDAYAEGKAVQVPNVRDWKTKLDKAKQAARKLQKALDELPEDVVVAIRSATWKDGKTLAYPPGGDPVTLLMEGTAKLDQYELTVNVYDAREVRSYTMGDRLVGLEVTRSPLTKPQRRDFATNCLIAVVANAFKQKTGKPPTFSVDWNSHAPERGGPFADLLRDVVVRSELGLDPDTVIRKAALLREKGSI